MEKYKWSSNGRFIGIIRLSAKGTDGVVKRTGGRLSNLFLSFGALLAQQIAGWRIQSLPLTLYEITDQLCYGIQQKGSFV